MVFDTRTKHGVTLIWQQINLIISLTACIVSTLSKEMQRPCKAFLGSIIIVMESQVIQKSQVFFLFIKNWVKQDPNWRLHWHGRQAMVSVIC